MGAALHLYFFNLRFSDGETIDYQSSNLPDLNTAKREARLILLELAIDHFRARRHFDLQSVWISTKTGSLLAEIDVEDVVTDLIPSYLFTCSTPDPLIT